MASLDDVARAQEETNGLLRSLIDLLRAGDGRGLTRGGGDDPLSGLPAGASQAGGSSAGGSFAGTPGSVGSPQRASAGPLGRQAIQGAANLGRAALDPMQSMASSGLASAESLAGAVGAAAGGALGSVVPGAGTVVGAAAGGALGKGLFAAFGGSQLSGAVDATIQDLQSTIDGLSAQGLSISQAQKDDLAKDLLEFNQFRFQELAGANQAVDKATGGALTKAAGERADAINEALGYLRVIANGVGSSTTRPDSALRGGE